MSFTKNPKKELVATFYPHFSLPCDAMLPWVWNHPNMVGWTLFTWIVFDLFMLALKNQPTWLRENNWMSMLIIRDTTYLIKGNTYGIRYKFLVVMLNLCATFMISLVVLK